MSAFGIIFSLPELQRKVLPTNKNAKNYYEKLCNIIVSPNEKLLEDEIFSKGSLDQYCLTSNELAFKTFLVYYGKAPFTSFIT